MSFIFSFSSYEQQALQRVRHVELSGTAVRFTSLEDLLIHKVIAGRPRDIEDVRVILLKNPDVDKAYVLDWLEQFAEALDVPLMKRFEDVWQATR